MSIKLAIFDLDGTLADSRADLTDSVNIVRARYGLGKMPMRRVATAVGRGVTHLLTHTIPAGTRKAHPGFMDEFRSIYWKRCTRKTRLYPGVVRTLKGLKGPVMAVVSNKPRRPTERILVKYGVRRLFRVVWGGDDLKRKKPDPWAIRALMRRFRVGPRETVVVGDSRFDMEAARRAGTRVVGVTYGFGTRAELVRWKPDAVIPRFALLPAVLACMSCEGGCCGRR
jgi:phosphoglycolate phosphatase